MGDLYASAVGTIVLQAKEIPKRPQAYDGVVVLFDLTAGVDESEIRKALEPHGAITMIEMVPTSVPPVTVRFSTHEIALAAVGAGSIEGLFGAICLLYNERSYDGRQGEEGRQDDTGRGWCCFEAAASRPPARGANSTERI